MIDVDATLVNVHSEKEGAAPTFKKGFGYHPLTAWFDHGPDGGGECAALVLRPGNAGSNTAADHVEIIRRALDQAGLGPGLGGGSWCASTGPEARRRPLSSWPVGGCPTAWGSRFPSTRRRSTGTIPETAWAPAYNADGQPRDGADVAETRRPAGPDRLAQGDAGQPCAESGPIRAPSCASRTWAATGPPPSPPARGWVSSPISRCATGCGPAARGPYPLCQGHRA